MRIEVRLYQELNDHLPASRRGRSFATDVARGTTVGELLGRLGVPSGEVDLALVDGVSVGLDRELAGARRVSLYPVFESFDVRPLSEIRDPPLRRLRFVVDDGLEPLATGLRGLGLAASSRAGLSEDALARTVEEGRWVLLSRSAGLAARTGISRAYRIRSVRLDAQLAEVLARFQLEGRRPEPGQGKMLDSRTRRSAMHTITSSLEVPVRERLIHALDVPDAAQAKDLVERLGESVRFYKLGLELFMAGGYFELVEWLRARERRVFVDLKFFDVPETVARAVRRLRDRGVDFATVHGNDAMLAAAAREKGPVKILAVTVLTSLDQGDLEDLGFRVSIPELVLSRARRALEVGCDGVISSGLEVPRLREAFGDRILVVSPGIRPVANRPADDQKRVVSVAQAFENGADYIVVGRPIRDAADPRAKAEEIQAQIAAVLGA